MEKTKHQRSTRKPQSLPISEWKWEYITIDFMTSLPKIQKSNDAAWVIVDRLTKSAHFLAFKIGIILEKWVELYISEIVRLHGVPISIV